MTNSIDTLVQGKAVYLEFTKSSMTQQVLIMPEGMSTSHKTVPMTIFRRRLSPVTPRKTWKAAASHYTAITLMAPGTMDKEEVVNNLLGFMHPLFHSLSMNGYTLYKDPVIVEVTAEDLELTRQGKTPYKTMARVWKARKALGFPKEYIHTEAVAASAV